LLLLGYAGALRRSELVAIPREHVNFTLESLRLLIARSRSDAAGEAEQPAAGRKRMVRRQHRSSQVLRIVS
jgi:hypothetical protein